MSLVEFKNVYKSYGEKEVLNDVSFGGTEWLGFR